MRILEKVIIVIVLGIAGAATAWHFVKSGKSDTGCGSCTCNKMDKNKSNYKH